VPRITNRVARGWAEKFVAKAADVGSELDYSIESLAEVDRLLEEHTEGGDVKQGGFFGEDGALWLFACGCYVGEVLRRAYGGFWRGEASKCAEASLRWVGGGIIRPIGKVFKRMANGPADNVQALVLGLALVATLPDKAYRKGLAALKAKQYKKAVVCLDSVLRSDPSRMEARLQRAIAYREAGHPSRAVRDCTRCIEAGSDPVNALLERGRAWEALKEYQRAVTDFTNATEIDPASAAAFVARGSTFLHYLYHLEQAIADFSRALQLQPTNSEALWQRAFAYLQLEDYKSAVVEYTRVIDLQPGIAGHLLNRAEAYRMLKQHEEALRDCSEACRLEPAYEMAYLYRGWLCEELGHYDRALADLAMTVALAPESGYILMYLARFWAKCSDTRFREPTKAIVCGKRACELYDESEAHEILASAYAAAGQYDLAAETQERAIERLRNAGQLEAPVREKRLADFTRLLEEYVRRRDSAPKSPGV
jgi:tetratricopeptide (TPR) repeat protein